MDNKSTKLVAVKSNKRNCFGTPIESGLIVIDSMLNLSDEDRDKF